MTTALQRLEKLLDERDERIEELETENRELKQQAEIDRSWCQHTSHTTDPSPDLPVPRLEIRWVERNVGDGYEVEARYALVYKHFLEHVVFVPLGMTRSSGSFARRFDEYKKWGHIDTPFRDGVHMISDMKNLGLRGFVILGDTVEEIAVCARCGRRDTVHKQPDPMGDCSEFVKTDNAVNDLQHEVVEAAQAFRSSGVPHPAWVRLWNALDALNATSPYGGKHG